MSLHSDYEIRWRNFKGFKDTNWIRIAPLTILIGANNSGKTSVLTPLLLMSQTMSSRDTLVPLVTQGSLADAGSFKDIVHNHDLTKSLTFGFRYHVHDVDKGERLKRPGYYRPGAFEISLTRGDRPEEMRLKEFEISDIFRRPFLKQTITKNGRYKLRAHLFGKLRPDERGAAINSRPINFLFSTASIVNTYHKRNSKDEKRKSTRDFSKGFSHYLTSISINFEELRNIFRSLSYIGPLRDRPHRYYVVTNERPASVGPHGEHMANLIRRSTSALRRELDRWIKKFEFGSKLKINELSEDLFSVSFENKNPRHHTNIASAGFGASQVLPLVVQALTARRDSLTIAEQPEIHLNPKLQNVLADLFVDMANNDRRVLVETHSEHLILHLRRLIAEKKIDRSKVAIYFVERGNEESTIKEIPLQQNGHISNESWPKGFFEDSLGEALALATAQAKFDRKLP